MGTKTCARNGAETPVTWVQGFFCIWSLKMPTLKVNNVDHGTETWSPEVRQQLKTLVATENRLREHAMWPSPRPSAMLTPIP